MKVCVEGLEGVQETGGSLQAPGWVSWELQPGQLLLQEVDHCTSCRRDQGPELGWLTSSVTDWLAGWLTGWLTGWLAGWLTD